MRAVPRLCGFYPGICLITEEKDGKTSVRVVRHKHTMYLYVFKYYNRCLKALVANADWLVSTRITSCVGSYYSRVLCFLIIPITSVLLILWFFSVFLSCRNIVTKCWVNRWAVTVGFCDLGAHTNVRCTAQPKRYSR